MVDRVPARPRTGVFKKNPDNPKDLQGPRVNPWPSKRQSQKQLIAQVNVQKLTGPSRNACPKHGRNLRVSRPKRKKSARDRQAQGKPDEVLSKQEQAPQRQVPEQASKKQPAQDRVTGLKLQEQQQKGHAKPGAAARMALPALPRGLPKQVNAPPANRSR